MIVATHGGSGDGGGGDDDGIDRPAGRPAGLLPTGIVKVNRYAANELLDRYYLCNTPR